MKDRKIDQALHSATITTPIPDVFHAGDDACDAYKSPPVRKMSAIDTTSRSLFGMLLHTMFAVRRVSSRLCSSFTTSTYSKSSWVDPHGFLKVMSCDFNFSAGDDDSPPVCRMSAIDAALRCAFSVMLLYTALDFASKMCYGSSRAAETRRRTTIAAYRTTPGACNPAQNPFQQGAAVCRPTPSQQATVCDPTGCTTVTGQQMACQPTATCPPPPVSLVFVGPVGGPYEA